jgi:hypothetical protein
MIQESKMQSNLRAKKPRTHSVPFQRHFSLHLRGARQKYTNVAATLVVVVETDKE